MTNPAEPDKVDTPATPAPPAPPAAQPAAPPAAPEPPKPPVNDDANVSVRELKEMLAGMPERIIDALKEARPEPAKVDPPKVADTSKPDVEPGKTPPPAQGKRTFADRWFGR